MRRCMRLYLPQGINPQLCLTWRQLQAATAPTAERAENLDAIQELLNCSTTN